MNSLTDASLKYFTRCKALKQNTGTCTSYIRSEKSTSTINVLPCRMHHNGPAKVTKRHWSPSINSEGSQRAYFRGRKLKGKELKLPTGYTGIVAKSAEPALRKQFLPVDENDSDLEEEQDSVPVKVLETISTFTDITVWGHDQTPTTEDPFVKGVEEWIAFARAMHESNDPVNVIQK